MKYNNIAPASSRGQPEDGTMKAMTKTTYTVAERLPGGDRGEEVTVRAVDEDDAAILGATKLGMRWRGKKPSTAIPAGGSLFVIYGPYDRVNNAQHRMGCVRVVVA